MTMRKSFLSMTIAFLPALLAAGPADVCPTGDLAKLQGRWTAKAGPKKDIPVTITVNGGDVVVDLKSPLGLAIHAEGRVKIDESTSPKTIDWVGFTLRDGQDMPEVLGLYVLDGDSFKMVNGGPNNARPSAFKKGDGVLADVLTFSRAKATEVAKGVKSKK
jgi:uncharacterized protein (TIGR03067 family)